MHAWDGLVSCLFINVFSTTTVLHEIYGLKGTLRWLLECFYEIRRRYHFPFDKAFGPPLHGGWQPMNSSLLSAVSLSAHFLSLDLHCCSIYYNWLLECTTITAFKALFSFLWTTLTRYIPRNILYPSINAWATKPALIFVFKGFQHHEEI